MTFRLYVINNIPKFVNSHKYFPNRHGIHWLLTSLTLKILVGIEMSKVLVLFFIASFWAYQCNAALLSYYRTRLLTVSTKVHTHIVWKLLKMSHFNFSIMAFSTTFCPIKTDLSGNTVWPQALQVFKNPPKWTILGIFN